MILLFLFPIVSLFALVWSLTIKNQMARLITLLVVACVALIFSTVEVLKYAGFILYLMVSVGILVYTWNKTSLKKKYRWIISVIVLPVFFYWAFRLLHLQGTEYLRYLLVLTLLGYLAVIVYRKKFRSEIGFLSIFAVDAFVTLFRF